MENENKTSGWMILVYLSPLYLLAAYPLYKWHSKINSENIHISKKDYREFASMEGEIQKPVFTGSRMPQLQDTGYSVNYKSTGKNEENLTQPRKKRASETNSNNAANTRDMEIRAIGSTKGYLTSAVSVAIKKPEALKDLFNNSLVVSGFMERDMVKSALKTTESLTNCINNSTILSDFANDKVVKEALNNPDVLKAISSSKLINSVITSPAVAGLINDPKKLKNILSDNPQLKKILSNPIIKHALLKNPSTSEAFSNLMGL